MRIEFNPSQATSGSINRRGVVQLGDLGVGNGLPICLIAEAGVNHNGDTDMALEMVDVAAEAGADFVKFQAFCADDLVTEQAAPADYQQSATKTKTQRELLGRLELATGAIARLKDHCAARRIGFIATPFGPKDLDMLVDLGVTVIKIASCDLTDWILLDRAIKTDLPLILSTGAATETEIEATVDRLIKRGCAGRIVLLHCVSAYPTPVDRINLRRIAALADRFSLPVGFSDHSRSVVSGSLSAAAGACVIEKHFTLDRNRPGPDQAASLEPDELAEYINHVRRVETILGGGQIDPQPIEQDVRRAARKSLVAAADLQPGDVIQPQTIAAKRAGGGICPTFIDMVIGSVVTKRVTRDLPIQWSMIRTETPAGAENSRQLQPA